MCESLNTAVRVVCGAVLSDKRYQTAGGLVWLPTLFETVLSECASRLRLVFACCVPFVTRLPSRCSPSARCLAARVRVIMDDSAQIRDDLKGTLLTVSHYGRYVHECLLYVSPVFK